MRYGNHRCLQIGSFWYTIFITQTWNAFTIKTHKIHSQFCHKQTCKIYKSNQLFLFRIWQLFGHIVIHLHELNAILYLYFINVFLQTYDSYYSDIRIDFNTDDMEGVFYCLSLFLLLLCFVGEAFLWFPLFPDGFFGELWVRENSRNSSFKFVLRSFCVIEAICLSNWQALIACENKRVLEAVGSIGRVDSLVEDVVLPVLAWWASFEEFVANLSNVSFKTPLLWVNLDISFSLSDLNLWFSSTSKLTGAGMSRTI